MKKYLFILPVLFLNFYLAPFAHAYFFDFSSTSTHDGVWTAPDPDQIFMLTDNIYRTGTDEPMPYENAYMLIYNNSGLWTRTVLSVDPNTFFGTVWPYANDVAKNWGDALIFENILPSPDLDGWNTVGPMEVGNNISIFWIPTSTVDFCGVTSTLSSCLNAQPSVIRICHVTVGTAGACTYENYDPNSGPSYIEPSLTRLGPDPAYTDLYAIPEWDRMQFLATASSTGNFRVKVNLFSSGTQIHLQKDFSQVATESSSILGWARMLNIPMTFSFGYQSSTWTYNAELFQMVPTAFGVLEYSVAPLNTGTIMFDPHALVPNSSSTYGVAPSSTYGDDVGYVVYGHDIRTRLTSDQLDTIFDKDCSGYSDTGLFSSSTLGAVACNMEKAGRGILKVLFKPGMMLDTPSYISAQFDDLKSSFPFSIFFGTMKDIQDTLAHPDTTSVSSTLAVQVTIPNGPTNETTTNIVIASPNFVRGVVGEHIWAQFTNVFILALGIASISGIVAWVFFL